jgi:hypothetical protein
MKRIFADTLYWVALIHRRDQWHQGALRVSRTLAGFHAGRLHHSALTDGATAYTRKKHPNGVSPFTGFESCRPSYIGR